MSRESRAEFFKEARIQLAILKNRPKLKRKVLIPLLTDLLTGLLLIVEEREREPHDVKSSAK